MAFTPARLQAQAREQGKTLRFALIVTRHGVRSPTWNAQRLNQYALEPWPEWKVGRGNLTEHGAELMRLMGSYYRQYFAEQGLLSKDSCQEAKHIFVWTDTDQRTLATGQALAAGLAPQCPVEVHSLESSHEDPLFHVDSSQFSSAERETAVASILGRIGGSTEAYMAAYQPALIEIEKVLDRCTAGDCAKQILLRQKSQIVAGSEDHLADITGPLSIASTFAENLQLEYLEGFNGADLGWGRLNADNLLAIMSLHTAYTDLARQTPYIARLQSVTLVRRILSTLAQAAEAKRRGDAIGGLGDKLVVLVGHDTNISNLASVLGVSWVLPGYVPNDVPPGSALVFELWAKADGRDSEIRLSFLAQSPRQMRERIPLSANNPPEWASLFLPDCSVGEKGYPCAWAKFQLHLALQGKEFLPSGALGRAGR